MSEPHTTNGRTAAQRGTAELIRDLGTELAELLRTEVRLARLELLHKGKEAGKGAALFGVAGVIALLGAMSLLAGVVLVLALVVPTWVSAFIVGGGFFLVAGAVAAFGGVQLKRSGPLVPEDATDGARTDLRLVKEAAKK
ncbi:putative membrane protein YqjE [Saccharopolyspora lacisalsi]|uniref:Putative membrane protein YqjE n=1 Tax=Halosaccharopolyspora lacisalsi TaxID=1000566 RepID=A0A839DSF3_9PSEU|nr:phage holin family protein [Halosaccharopolyspora lacisalsi]MBA8824922.1 putative membrane protein YqjE [Halosaccharopolyspora lacisalsi]